MSYQLILISKKASAKIPPATCLKKLKVYNDYPSFSYEIFYFDDLKFIYNKLSTFRKENDLAKSLLCFFQIYPYDKTNPKGDIC